MDRELKEGMIVRVAFAPGYKIIDGSRKFDGMDLAISKVRNVRRWYSSGIAVTEKYYELEGAESKKHTPYGFILDNLIPLS